MPTTPTSPTNPTTSIVRPTRTAVPATGLRKPTVPGGTTATASGGKPTPSRNGDRRVAGVPAKPTAEPVCRPDTAAIAAPALAASASEAVAAALRGEATRLPLNDAEAQGLAVRELIPRGDQRAFEVGLGKLRFEIVVNEASDAAGVLGRVLPMLAQIPEPVRSSVRRVTILQPDQATMAYVAELADARGKLAPIAVKRAVTNEKTATYTVSDANGKFELVTPADAQDAWEVAQAFNLWAMIPPALRGALKTISVDDGPNPTDEYWAKEYKNPDFTSAATGGNGATNFWHGTKFLKEDYFLHEFGHVLGQTYSSKNTMVPDGWEDAMAADNRSVTRYGENSPTEDFAESFFVYLTLQKGGRVTIADPPADLAGFVARWPRRAAILDAIFRGELRPMTR